MFDASCFLNRKLKIILSLNNFVLQVKISKVYKINIKTLRTTILNKFRIQYFKVETIKLTRDIYIFALYYLRLYYIFLTLTKINIVNNLQLIEEKILNQELTKY